MPEEITVNGLRFRVSIESDDTMGAPWEEHDGHGVVTDWTARPKTPGERVLSRDGGLSRYYDIKASMKLALKDHWGPIEPGMSKRQIAAAAVERDFENLKAWCNDEWMWVSVVVVLLDVDGNETKEGGSLSGIESDAGEYLDKVALELAEEISDRVGNADTMSVRIRPSALMSGNAFIRARCVRCNQDIEGCSGGDEWRDRGNNTHCPDDSGKTHSPTKKLDNPE